MNHIPAPVLERTSTSRIQMPASIESARAVAEYWVTSTRLNNYSTLVAFAILYYDYALTLSVEIEHFWKSANISIMSIFYVVNRYYGLLGPIPFAIEFFADVSEYRCRQLQTFHQAFAISSQAIVAIMLVIRTYALYDRNKKILTLLIITHVGGAVGCLVAMVTAQSPVKTKIPLPFTFTGCDLSLTNAQGRNLAIAWGAMLWFDTTIFVLTLVRALRMRRHSPGGLLEVMFRDGTIYYGILVASNVSNIVTFVVTPSGSMIKGMNTTLTNVLSTTLISRLLLNLRDPSLRARHRVGSSSTTGEWTSMITPPTTSYMMSTRYTLTQIEASGNWAETTEDQEAVECIGP